MTSHSEQDQESSAITKAEWFSFAVSFVLLLAIVGLLTYDWLGITVGPPELSAFQSGDVREDGQYWYVPFVVQNDGGVTVSEVLVEAKWSASDGSSLTIDQQVAYVASGEQQSGAFMFEQDPRLGDLKLTVTGYQLP